MDQEGVEDPWPNLTWHSPQRCRQALIFWPFSTAIYHASSASSGPCGLLMWRAKWEWDGCGWISKHFTCYWSNMKLKCCKDKVGRAFCYTLYSSQIQAAAEITENVIVLLCWGEKKHSNCITKKDVTRVMILSEWQCVSSPSSKKHNCLLRKWVQAITSFSFKVGDETCRKSSWPISAECHSEHNDCTLVAGAPVSAKLWLSHCHLKAVSFFLTTTLKHGVHIMAIISLTLILAYVFLLCGLILTLLRECKDEMGRDDKNPLCPRKRDNENTHQLSPIELVCSTYKYTLHSFLWGVEVWGLIICALGCMDRRKEGHSIEQRSLPRSNNVS